MLLGSIIIPSRLVSLPWGSPAVISPLRFGSCLLRGPGWDEPTQVTLSNQLFDLILEIDALLSVMAMVAMEATIFRPVSLG